MKSPTHWKFTIILIIIGFMVAVQYNSIKNPEKRDTRDIWAIRQELAKERQIHSELLSEIQEIDRTIRTYKTLDEKNAGSALAQTVDKLHVQAGLTDITGPGLHLTVEPSPESIAYGLPITGISPDLLTRFVNELNRFKGIILEIDGKRFTMMSSIRDINGKTSVNGLQVSTPPFNIKIISPSFIESEKLYNYLLGSSIHDDFYLDNLILKIGEPASSIRIKGGSDPFENQFLKELPKGE